MDVVKSKNSSSDDDKSSAVSQLSMTHVGFRGAVKRFGMKAYDQALINSHVRQHRRFRWKMMTRVIMYFVRWEKIKSSGKDRGFVMRRIVAGRVQERVFNAEQFSKVVQQYQIMTIHAKLLLYKEPQQRSKQDRAIILGYLNRMACFNKFSVFTKRQLASKIRYNCYDKGEVLFKEGARPIYCYFLLSGSVQLYTTVTVPLSESELNVEESEQKAKTIEKRHRNPITEGSSFGEHGFQDSQTRKFAVKAVEPCECFTLENEDFIGLLGAYHDEERTMKANVIRRLPQVAGVSEADIKRAMDSSYTKTFNKGDVIVKGEDYCRAHNKIHDTTTAASLDTYGHVIVSGSAVLEKRLFINQEPLPCGTTIARLPTKLPDYPQNKVLKRVTQRVRASIALEEPAPIQGKLDVPPPPPVFPTLKYLSVRTYIQGDLFLPFVHEEDYVIGAKEATTILYLPKTPFMLHKSGEVMVKLFDELSNAKITVEEQLKEYNSRRIWKDYRKQLVRQVLVDKLMRNSRTCR